MHGSRWRVTGLGVAAVLLLAQGAADAGAQTPAGPGEGPPRASVVDLRGTVNRVSLEQVTPPLRERVRLVLEQPTLYAQGPAEIFLGRLELYEWLLDHPDRAARAWQRLGARCMDITDRGDGTFGWNDGQGSDIRWQTAQRGSRQRVWYAEGSLKPAPFLAAVPIHAVVVLRYGEAPDGGKRPLLRHQADIFFQTDSKTAALVARMLGPSAPRLAEQCLTQLQTFFAALTWYAEHYPDRAERVLRAPGDPGRAGAGKEAPAAAASGFATPPKSP
jgi:hypothetical protein